eukprot:scaffold2045_cov203-Alexandrium_tamarense.AAC.40
MQSTSVTTHHNRFRRLSYTIQTNSKATNTPPSVAAILNKPPSNMTADQTAFPRGKRPKTSSSSSAKAITSTSASSSAAIKHDKPSKKRPADASSTANNSNNEAVNKEKDFLFGSSNDLDLPAKKKKHTATSDHHHSSSTHLVSPTISTLPLGGGAVLPSTSTSNGRRIPPKIELLTFSKLARGTKVLGVVREVKEEYGVVSLCTMLTGFVRRSAVSV